MAMKNTTRSINLLRNRKTFLDNFISWALTLGRLVIILTEAVALSAFLYRFFLDRELVDLHDKILAKQAIIKLSKSNEDKFRNLQERLASIKTLTVAEKKLPTMYQEIFGIIPQEITVNSFVLKQENLTIAADVPSISSLAAFVSALQGYPSINSISIDKIENKTANVTISVGITALLKGIPIQPVQENL